MNELKTYILHEWESIDKSNELSSEESNKLNQSFLSYFNTISSSESGTIGNFKKRNIIVKNGLLSNLGNNIGIIKIENYRLEFKPKMEYFWKFLPKMLDTLCGFEDFDKKLFLDPAENIELPQGLNMVPLLALSFVSLCNKVIEKGMIKRYIQKDERLNLMKGRINFSRLVMEKPWDLSSIPCVYYDPTFDNPENQIILWCAQKLLKETRKIESKGNDIFVVKKLREQYTLMSNEISLLPKTALDMQRINLSGIAAYYIKLMGVCKAILKESLFSFNEEGRKTTGINFILDMDWIFEQYMTHIFNQVAQEFPEIKIESQVKQSLGDKNTLKIIPDLIIFKSNKPLSVIDFKWKLFENNKNADYYQIICYGLAELQKGVKINDLFVNLFSVSDGKNEIEQIDTISSIFYDKKIIHINKIPLDSNIINNENTEEIETNIKEEIRKYLISITKNDYIKIT